MSATSKPAPERRDTAPVVLLVEADVLARTVVSDHLRTCRYRVYEVATSDEALMVLGAPNLRIDAVFAPVHAQGSRDGFALAQWIRRHKPGVKVVLSSGIARPAPPAGLRRGDGAPPGRPFGSREVEQRIRAALGPAGTPG